MRPHVSSSRSEAPALIFLEIKHVNKTRKLIVQTQQAEFKIKGTEKYSVRNAY